MNGQFDHIFCDTFPKEVTPASSVERKIHAVIQTMGNLFYLYDNWAVANIKLDSISYPAVINVLPVSGTFNVSARKLRDNPNVMLAFVDKTDFDFDGKENGEIVERCKNLAMEFILTANQSGLFEPIEGEVRYSVLYDKLDVNITGIVLELVMKEKQGINLCVNKPIKDYFNEQQD